MAPDLYDAWYFLSGLLLANGVPQFVLGSAGRLFRSPFGRRSPPKVNVVWGMANFLLATVIGLALASLGYDSYSLASLLLGFWLMVLYFWFAIGSFLGE